MVTPIGQAVNVGPVLGVELRRAGIETLEALTELGYVSAWTRLRAVAPDRDCAHALLAMAGAIEGVRWTALPKATRARIAQEARALRAD